MVKMFALLWLFNDPYSVKGLRKRALRLPECPYRLVLEMAADQLEEKKVTKDVIKKAIEYVRTGNEELISVAIKMLNLNNGQISVALNLLKGMKNE